MELGYTFEADKVWRLSFYDILEFIIINLTDIKSPHLKCQKQIFIIPDTFHAFIPAKMSLIFTFQQ